MVARRGEFSGPGTGRSGGSAVDDFRRGGDYDEAMSISARALAIDTFVPTLRSLANVLDKGAQHASTKGFDVAVLVRARLAPDMYTLAQQVQLACHHAKDAAARLTGQEPTPPSSAEETFDQLEGRVKATIQELQKMPAAAFEGADDRDVVIPITGGAMAFEMKGYQFLRDWALPHFYFHVVTAYDILRHNGVEIGKRDYVGNVGGYIRPRR